jgi:hypothetical protein
MFTGIIEEIGIVESIKKTGEAFVLSLNATKVRAFCFRSC